MNEEQFLEELIADTVHLDKLFVVDDLLEQCIVLDEQRRVDHNAHIYDVVYDLKAKNRLVFNNKIYTPVDFDLVIAPGTEFKMYCRSRKIQVNSILYLKSIDNGPLKN